MNVIVLMGRLTDHPELQATHSGTSVVRFCIAVDRAYTPKGQERQTDFINCVAWRGTAEFISRYFRKGQRIALQGSLQSRHYEDRDGNKRTAFEVIADQVFFVESKQKNEDGGEQTDFAPPADAGDTETAANEEYEVLDGDLAGQELPL